MKISVTSIPDINHENINLSKVSLANKIIGNVRPLFDDVFIEKNVTIKNLEEELENKKNYVKESKNRLQKKLNLYNKNKKVNKLLDRIEKMINLGILYDGSMKNEMVVVLKILEKLDERKIDNYLAETLKEVNKRFK